jgi:hypothetical protein
MLPNLLLQKQRPSRRLLQAHLEGQQQRSRLLHPRLLSPPHRPLPDTLRRPNLRDLFRRRGIRL